MQPFPSPAPSLYCAEDAEDVASWEDAGDEAWAPPPSSPSSPRLFPASLQEPDRPITDLFAAEVEHMPGIDYIGRFRDGSLDSAARRDAIDWILKVNAFYHFRPVTATLSVNYLDRFLSSQTLPKGIGWPWQLLSVACLSVAAKMEETHVPLLVDLQIMEPRFVFDPRTARRMELLLMSALRWRMRAVTPFDFLDHFAGLLSADASSQPGDGYAPLFRRASDLIVGTLGVLDFLVYRPSEVAAAAVLCASGERSDVVPGFYNFVIKVAVDRCRRLMAQNIRPKGAPVPPSPAGVLDAAACGSSDTQKSSSDAAAPDPRRHHLQRVGAERPAKRRKLAGVSDAGQPPEV